MFRSAAHAALRNNVTANQIGGRKPGDNGYLIETHADVARELSRLAGHKVQQRIVDRILGGVREGTKIKLLDASIYIRPIREMLGIQHVPIIVPADRAETLLTLAAMPPSEFTPFAVAASARKKL